MGERRGHVEKLFPTRLNPVEFSEPAEGRSALVRGAIARAASARASELAPPRAHVGGAGPTTSFHCSRRARGRTTLASPRPRPPPSQNRGGMYLQGGGSIRFAAGFVAGVLLREAAMRKGKKPPQPAML